MKFSCENARIYLLKYFLLINRFEEILNNVSNENGVKFTFLKDDIFRRNTDIGDLYGRMSAHNVTAKTLRAAIDVLDNGYHGLHTFSSGLSDVVYQLSDSDSAISRIRDRDFSVIFAKVM